MKLQDFSVNCLITCWKRKISHLFPNRILALHQHEGLYSKMCHLGKEGIYPHPLPLCFVLILRNLNTMPTGEFWSDWLIFLLFSLMLTFCSDYVYHNVPSSWHQNWCRVSLCRLGLGTPGCLRETIWSSWDLGVTLANENILGSAWNGSSPATRVSKGTAQMRVLKCCFGPVRLEGNPLRKSSSSKKTGWYFLSLWNPAGFQI